MKNKKEVIKASGAIHISNGINLMQRRSWNILLSNAFNELIIKDEFTIKIKDLSYLLKYEGHNTSYIKQLVYDLQNITVEWNLLGKDGDEWGRSVLLSGVIIKNGKLIYAYDPILKKKLYNPLMYAKINLSLQNKFKSKHSLALYELFLDYFNEKNSYGETPYITIKKIKQLLGLKEDEYKKFKYFNDCIIKKSIKEINQKSNLLVEIKYEKNGRNIIAVKFIINKNLKTKNKLKVFEIPQNEELLVLDNFESENKNLFNILTLEFGISQNKTINILKTTDELCIKENLEIVKKEIKKGNVKNISAYTIKALTEDFRSKKLKEKIEKEKEKRIMIEEKNKKREELGSKIFKKFTQKKLNPEIQILIDNFIEPEKSKFNNWINKNSVYRNIMSKNNYLKFEIYQIYLKKKNLLNDVDEKFIAFATDEGYKVKKTSSFIDKWIVLEKIS